MTSQLFVDESKRTGFIMVAVQYDVSLLDKHRKEISNQLRSGQRRIHFKSERDSVRRQLLQVIASQRQRTYVFTASSRYEPVARIECLNAVCAVAVEVGANRLVVERDETRDRDDRHTLTEALRDGKGDVTWEIQQPSAEPLLWVADAIGWCWGHPQKRWRDAIRGLQIDHKQL